MQNQQNNRLIIIGAVYNQQELLEVYNVSKIVIVGWRSRYLGQVARLLMLRSKKYKALWRILKYEK